MSKKHELEITRESFRNLPALVPRAVFMTWTNYSDEAVSEGVADGTIPVHRRKAGGQAKYYKTTIAKICGFTF